MWTDIKRIFYFEANNVGFLFRFEVEVKQKLKCELSEKEAKQIPFALFRFEEFFSDTRSPYWEQIKVFGVQNTYEAFTKPIRTNSIDGGQWVISNARFVEYKMCFRSIPWTGKLVSIWPPSRFLNQAIRQLKGFRSIYLLIVTYILYNHTAYQNI